MAASKLCAQSFPFSSFICDASAGQTSTSNQHRWSLVSLTPPPPLCASLQVADLSPSPRGNDEGLCFADGKRKVDYVLVFHQRRHSSIRCPTSTSASHDRLSIVSNGNFPTSAGSDADQGRGGIQGADPPSVGEVFVELGGSEATEPADHENHLIRQEFEASLAEAGLEVERESEVSAVHLQP